ncbi:MAG TPA: PIN domain-containing protein [Thermoanaerobaculia bacterium]|jgi:predicted nucleic acid-binding protein|nr:PIN domain-containing protein [Thermoanaerobaculia bacterium]
MKQILVDANVFISFLTDRDARQSERAAALLRGAAEQEQRLVLHSMSIVEMIYVLTKLYHQDPESVGADVADLLAVREVVTTDEVMWSLVLERWPRTILELGDAILAAAASGGQFDAVATFDRNLAKRLVKQGSTLFWPVLPA